jgi:hypothetical protein
MEPEVTEALPAAEEYCGGDSLAEATLSTSTLPWISSRMKAIRSSLKMWPRLSPLVFEHINLLGRYAFLVPDSVVRGQLRPLRNPVDASEDVA